MAVGASDGHAESRLPWPDRTGIAASGRLHRALARAEQLCPRPPSDKRRATSSQQQLSRAVSTALAFRSTPPLKRAVCPHDMCRGKTNAGVYNPNASTNLLCTGLELGSRVRLLPDTDGRRGAVAFLGLVPEIPGIGSWVGIALDEPTGKNDGAVQGKRYFQCAKNCGIFVRPARCEAGDFPPLGLDDEDLEEL